MQDLALVQCVAPEAVAGMRLADTTGDITVCDKGTARDNFAASLIGSGHTNTCGDKLMQGHKGCSGTIRHQSHTRSSFNAS